jgi:hypothetical protein
MPVISLQDQQFALRPGETRLGGGAGVDVPVSTDAALGVQALVSVAPGDQVAIRRATDAAVVRVNGVLLGVEPTPLMHGDRIEISGRELLYADDRKGGATQFMSSSDALAAVQKRTGASRPTAATGGRLVSLVDGKEYAISEHGASIGRDAACDVVVPDSQVSRRHAEVVPTDVGYEVQDHSTNGVFVNGTRVEGKQLLARADVIRVGGEEFRFYADMATAAAPPSPAQVADRPSLRATGSMPSLPKPQPAVPATPALPSAASVRATPAVPAQPTSARSRAWVWPVLIIVVAAAIAALYLRYR